MSHVLRQRLGSCVRQFLQAIKVEVTILFRQGLSLFVRQAPQAIEEKGLTYPQILYHSE